MRSWEEFAAERARFERWEEHWTLVYDRLFQGSQALAAVGVFAHLFGYPDIGWAALGTQMLAFPVWRLVARHRFRGMDRWLGRLRKMAKGEE